MKKIRAETDHFHHRNTRRREEVNKIGDVLETLNVEVPVKTVSGSSSTDISPPEITGLPGDVLGDILERLSLIDILRAKAVSSSWNSSIEAFLSSDPHVRLRNTPSLMLPPQQQGEEGYRSYSNRTGDSSHRILNLEENMVYSLKKTTSDLFLGSSSCIGSSHGWLIFLDTKTLIPFLFNPFTEVRIQLPSLKSPFCKYCACSVVKAILTAEPGEDYYVVLMLHFNGPKLAYYKDGDRFWTELYDSRSQTYQDIISYGNNKLYGICPNGAIHCWDLWGCFGRPGTKIIVSTATLPAKSVQKIGYFSTRSSSNYLVELCGEILLVVRFICSERLAPMECRYRTELFDVYKLDLKRREWEEVKSLGDWSLFVGGNHSVSVSTKDHRTCKGNSIYFTTDDFWFRDYSGCDMGIYSLKDGEVMSLFKFPRCKDFKFQPPSRWLVPRW
ncbi:hypothetical protein SLA2020_161550 [Shorea laevis]